MGDSLERKIFIEDLPHWPDDSRYSGKIKWSECIGCNVRFNFYGIDGVVKILDYDSKNRMICILYNSKKYTMNAKHFKDARLGHLIRNITGDYKIEIGKHLTDFNRDLIILDRKKEIRIDKDNKKRIDKVYRYKCNKCGYDCSEAYDIKTMEWREDYWAEESNLIRGKSGCACCSKPAHVVVPKINSLMVTKPELAVFFQNGESEASIYTPYSDKKIYPICPFCKQIKKSPIMIKKLVRDQKISCPCNDSFRFPEKIMYFVLDSLKVNFIFQLTKVNYEWCEGYRYDFSFIYNGELIIIETHGEQHYKSSNRGRRLKQEQENDRKKKKNAIKNGVKNQYYIVIDCRYSDFEYIKTNILKSKLGEILDLSLVDWIAVCEGAHSNLVKKACEYKNNNNELSATDISKLMKLDRSTISRYLKIGAQYGWCSYDPDIEKKRGNKRATEKNRKNLSYRVMVFSENKEELGIFDSANELERISIDLFGVVLYKSRIRASCRSGKKYKNYYFKYIK